MPKLIVNPGTEQSWEIPLPDGVTVLGSDPAMEFSIAHESVTPSHIEVTVKDGVVTVKDLGSTGGTFVNGASVVETRVEPGQRVHLGEVELELVGDGITPGNPPIPPRIAPAAVPAAGRQTANANCKYHPRVAARWRCDHCQAAFCDLCVNARQAGGGVRHLCRKCGNDCTPVVVHYEEPAVENFYKLLPGVFGYPFHGAGTILLVSGTVLFAVFHVFSYTTSFVPAYGSLIGLAVGVCATGYLFNYAKQIVVSSAQGENLPPDWPDISDWMEELVQPCGQLFALLVLTFGPAIVLRWWHPLGDEYTKWLRLAALVVGALFAPMAMLLLAMADSIAALNPVPIIRSILRIPLPYVIAAAIFELVLCAYVAISMFAHYSGALTLLISLVTGFLELYAISVGMRVLGLLYRTHKSELGWFERP